MLHRMKKPNLNGPRFREKFTTLLNISTFKALVKKYPEYKDLELQEFKDIIMSFNNHVVDGMIENRNGVEFPDGLGFIFMGTCPPKKETPVDYARSHEYGIKTSFRNWDSDNHLLKIFYTNYNTKNSFQNKRLWMFKAAKPVRSKASHAYKQDWTKYIVIDPTRKISIMFDRQRKKQYAQNLKPVIPDDYDEFKI